MKGGFWGPWLYGLALGLGFVIASALANLNCYATTGPTPTCADDPNGPGCLAPLSDDIPAWAQSEKKTDASR